MNKNNNKKSQLIKISNDDNDKEIKKTNFSNNLDQKPEILQNNSIVKKKNRPKTYIKKSKLTKENQDYFRFT